MGKSYSSIAGLSLVVASTGFLASLPWQGTLVGGIIHAASEASLVGGVADWYAVTALFRHPLGQKWIPHTAIIPKNRERIIDGIVDMVENQWLTKEIIKEKIERISILPMLLPYLEKGQSRDYLMNWAVSFIQGMVGKVDTKELAEFLNNLIKTEGKKMALTPHLANLLSWARESNYEEQIFNFLYREAQKLADSPKLKPMLAETINRGVQDFLNGGGGGMMAQLVAPLLKNLNYDEFAGTLQKLIQQFLIEQKDNYQEKFSQFVVELLGKLQNDQELAQVIEAWKEDALDKISLTDSLVGLIESIQKSNWLSSSSLDAFLNRILDKEINSWLEKPEKTEKIEKWFKEQIFHFIEKRHNAIGKLVRENLEKLSQDDFVTIIEERVGSDLQWIRVNGAVVGGMIGIALYLLKHFIL